MVGLSGGGWTTTVYSALDPTIRLSVPVAGSKPHYLRGPRLSGDFEQVHEPFYEIAGFPDLYAMASAGVGRRQVQVLNRHDPCCWGEAQHNTSLTGIGWEPALRDYETRVQDALRSIGSGSFRVHIDEVEDQHAISDETLSEVILHELSLTRTCPATPGGCTEAHKATVIVKRDPDDPVSNRFWWSWRGPAAAEVPRTADTEYIACVYSDGALVADYTVEAQEDSGGRACWSDHDGKSRYRSHSTNDDGISRLTMHAGSVLLRGEGARLPFPKTTPLFSAHSPVSILFLRTDASQCWQSTFAPPARLSTGTRFRDSTQ